MDDWLQRFLAYIPGWIDFQLRQSEQVGCLVAVVHEGELALEHAAGVANLTTGEPLTPRHRFRIASHSKSFTATGLMLLRERGRLKLDDTIGTFVDGLHDEVARATIGQLMSHTAGLTRDGSAGNQYSGLRPFANKDEVLADLSRPPVIDRNTRFKYSNHGFALLGLAIEALTGESYKEWIRREVVTAFGLSETEPDMPLPQSVPFARGHTSKVLLGERLVIPGDYEMHALAPAGGFVSTAADLARFFAQLSPNASSSPLSADSRREMTHGRWKNLHATLATTYGLGTGSGTLEDWLGLGLARRRVTFGACIGPAPGTVGCGEGLDGPLVDSMGGDRSTAGRRPGARRYARLLESNNGRARDRGHRTGRRPDRAGRGLRGLWRARPLCPR
jgi:CubicO group peptidase (beta-lactamase class C family)